MTDIKPVNKDGTTNAHRGKLKMDYYLMDYTERSDELSSLTNSQDTSASHRSKLQVCRVAFEQIYGLSRTKNRTLHQELKSGRVKAKAYSDRSTVPRKMVRELSTQPIMMHTAEGMKEIHVTADDLVLAGLSNSERYRKGYAWLDNFLKIAACHEPNGSRLLLERQTKAEIYQLYVNSEEFNGANASAILDKKEFIKLFSAVPNVSIRKFKTVSGKCNNCATLTVLRQKFTTREHRRGIAKLHALHRTTYMGERKAYYQRCAKAEREPDKYMSIIVDGMAQNHTNLPYLANRKEFSPCLDMHLEGVIEHGQSFTMYRTFNNVAADSNLTIHIILKQIEKRLQRQPRVKGKPFTLFLQVDGGSENANRYLIAMCEFLVARKIFTNIELTRLPVGHTHEDIDGKFGTLWKLIRNRAVATPQEYERAMREAFNKDSFPFYMEDIFAVPDYGGFFRNNLDSQFGRFAKEELTQLCFRFERYEQDLVHFPLCVRTMYRAYSRDRTYELLETKDPAYVLGYVPALIINKWGPLACDKIYNSTCDGMHILQSFPDSPLTPAAFVNDFRQGFNKTYTKVMTFFHKIPDYVREWEQFKNIFPNVPFVEDYIGQPGARYEIPLKNSLFKYLYPRHERQPLAPSTQPPIEASFTLDDNFEPSRVLIATHAIQWNNNGDQPRLIVPSRLDVVTNQSGETDMEESLKAYYESIEITKDSLEMRTVPTLQSLCKHYGINFYVKRKKAYFVELILNHFGIEIEDNTNNNNNNDDTNNNNNNNNSLIITKVVFYDVLWAFSTRKCVQCTLGSASGSLAGRGFLSRAPTSRATRGQ